MCCSQKTLAFSKGRVPILPSLQNLAALHEMLVGLFKKMSFFSTGRQHSADLFMVGHGEHNLPMSSAAVVHSFENLPQSEATDVIAKRNLKKVYSLMALHCPVLFLSLPW